jgi:aspartate-semialdehyde dehydrogenase
MAALRSSPRMVLAGASSLLGGEIKSLLEESRFAGWDLVLVDEDEVAGTLTEARGEAALIERMEADTFRGARFALLAGSSKFSKQCVGPAHEAGATVIDFSYAALSDPDAVPWFPKIESLTGKTLPRSAKTFCVFSAGGAAVSRLALLLRKFDLQRLVANVNQPVSDAGRAGIEELEMQTTQLLSFQPTGSPVFGTQTAFNVLSAYGPESRHDLQRRLLETRAEISAALGDAQEDAQISLNLLHVPVFYGITFSVCADLGTKVEAEALSAALREAGFQVAGLGETSPSNISAAGERELYLAPPRPDHTRQNTWWLLGAGDNLRFAAASGLQLAESLDS